MKKALKFFLWFVCIVFTVILILIFSLNGYYNVLEKRKIKQDISIRDRHPDLSFKNDTIMKAAGEPVLNLIPVPQKVIYKKGNCSIQSLTKYFVTDSLKDKTGKYLETVSGVNARFSPAGADIYFKFKKECPGQGYTMDILPGKITVEYSSFQGLYYALVSLKILNNNYNGTVPCVYIEDYPDLEVRGLMLDISRDKVPTLETLKSIAQILADLKYNHFELYIEGFSFAYPSFKELWEGKETPVTGDEIRYLDKFCKERFIDLVPNQNSLGHMMAWLATDEFNDLAECPKGYKLFGLVNMKGTLNPLDPRSLELVTRMTDDLLPNFSSSGFNADLDEPFELGQGRSKKVAVEIGAGKLYLDYALKIHEMLKSKNKSMLMWGDIVLRHPDILPQIPKDITLLDWGYEDIYPYEKNCKTFLSAGVKYMVCPGTNSWTTIAGRTDNMLNTIENATVNGVRYGAAGMLNTDWGDMGHWQYLPVSYAGYTAGAALSWNSGSRKEMPLPEFLSSFIFRDKSQIMGHLVLDMGRYNRFEEIPVPNMTTTMMAFQYGLRDDILVSQIYKTIRLGIAAMMNDLVPELSDIYSERYDNRHPFDYGGLEAFLSDHEKLLDKVNIEPGYDQLVADEYRNAIRLIRAGAGLQYYINNRRNLSVTDQQDGLQSVKSLLMKYLEENERLWMLRNKAGGYERSTAAIHNIIYQIDNRLLQLEKSSFIRGLNRFFEKAVAAGMVIYLKSVS